jgi:FkbM family methyltransferase
MGGVKRAIIHALDRPGGRTVLGVIGTRMARRSASEVRLFFRRSMWMHQSGAHVFVDSPTFDYYRRRIFSKWSDESGRYYRDAQDFWFHADRPRLGDVVLDIGAGKGEHTVAFAKAVGPTGRVFAIEAHPVTFRCLELFCEINQLTNVTPLNYAIADCCGTVDIDMGADWLDNSIVPPGRHGSATVPSLTLDELLVQQKIQQIGLLKMNIEGAEALAIKGMKRAFEATRALCISCHDFRANQGHGDSFRTKTQVEEAVTKAGFRIIPRDSDPRDYVADQVNAVRN